MPSTTFSSILGAALGSLFYGTRLFVGFLNPDSDKSEESFSAENKINNHLKVAYEKIEKWKRENNINCQIILAYGNDNSQTIDLNLGDIVAGEHKDIFQRTLGESLSKFERLGYDLELEKIGLVDEAGEDTDYNYSQRLRDACNGKSSITLTFQNYIWDAKNREQQNHSFWLPKEDTNIRTQILNYLKRDLLTPFRKIQQWKSDNSITCEINLFVNNSETIVVSEIEKNLKNYIGSTIFARNLDDKVPGRKLSKFEKFANDLTSAKINVKDEVGDDSFFEYSKKIKKECSGKQPITLNFREFTWGAGLDKKKETQKHSFWVPGNSSDEREQIFNYLDRDIKTPIEKINEWKQKNSINCPIKMRMQGDHYVSIDDISKDPNKHIGHSHFSKTEAVKDGGRISLFQKLVNGLNDKVEINDKYGNKEIYDYTGKLRQICEDRNEIKLVHYKKTWDYTNDKSATNTNKQQLAYWFPENVANHEQLILEFLDWNRESLLKKLEDWKTKNNCEITLILKEQKGDEGKGTVKEIIEKPYKFPESMGLTIFDKKFFIGKNDEFSSTPIADGQRISQIEKLVKDLTKESTETKGQKGEVKSNSYSEKIKKDCTDGKVELAWRVNMWKVEKIIN